MIALKQIVRFSDPVDVLHNARRDARGYDIPQDLRKIIAPMLNFGVHQIIKIP
jgi:hypothetical protein